MKGDSPKVRVTRGPVSVIHPQRPDVKGNRSSHVSTHSCVSFQKRCPSSSGRQMHTWPCKSRLHGREVAKRGAVSVQLVGLVVLSDQVVLSGHVTMEAARQRPSDWSAPHAVAHTDSSSVLQIACLRLWTSLHYLISRVVMPRTEDGVSAICQHVQLAHGVSFHCLWKCTKPK